MKIDLRMMAALVLGGLSGIGGGIAGGQWLRADEPEGGVVSEPAPRGDAQPNEDRPSSPTALVTEGRPGTLQQHLTSMNQDRSRVPPTAPASVAPSTSPPQDPVQLREEALNQWSARLQQHASEPIDASWSRSAAIAFGDDLQQAAEAQHFQLIATDCRSTSCTATLQWSDYGAAVSNYTSLLYQETQLGCARAIVLPEPLNREAPYQASLLYDCSSLRPPK